VKPPESAPPVSVPAALPATRRPIVETTSPERYRVQFMIGKESHDKLRRVQALLRREIPNGDPGAIFDRAIALLLERVEKEKLGAVTMPRAPRAIRPGTDSAISSARLTSRHTPSHVKRSAWQHDGGQCAFVSRRDADAPSAPSWSSITSGPTRWEVRPRPRTSRFAVAATINTRPS
jgi:hypothetical protein